MMATPYDNWELDNWDTPLRREKGLDLDKLIARDGGILVVTYDSNLSRNRKSYWELLFEHPYSYRILNESYMNGLWARRKQFSDIGNTFTVKNSTWLSELRTDPLFSIIKEDLFHFVIATGDHVLEVISDAHPQISERTFEAR